jgi:hypothetical protein
VAVAGCGGGSSDKTSGVVSLGGADSATSATRAGASSDPIQAALAFARCMRQHGINLPNPGPRGGIDLRANGVNPESPQFKAAEPGCWRSSGFLR